MAPSSAPSPIIAQFCSDSTSTTVNPPCDLAGKSATPRPERLTLTLPNRHKSPRTVHSQRVCSPPSPPHPPRPKHHSPSAPYVSTRHRGYRRKEDGKLIEVQVAATSTVGPLPPWPSKLNSWLSPQSTATCTGIGVTPSGTPRPEWTLLSPESLQPGKTPCVSYPGHPQQRPTFG